MRCSDWSRLEIRYLLAGTPFAVRAGPHVVAGLGGDNQLVAVRLEVVLQVAAEVGLGGAVRRAVVVGQVKVVDAEVEGAAQDGALLIEALVVAEVVPQAKGDGRKFESAASDAAVGHGFIAVVRCRISHTCNPASCDAGYNPIGRCYAAG
jgi:hypothetical protein